jgi:hypothetical protein
MKSDGISKTSTRYKTLAQDQQQWITTSDLLVLCTVIKIKIKLRLLFLKRNAVIYNCKQPITGSTGEFNGVSLNMKYSYRLMVNQHTGNPLEFFNKSMEKKNPLVYWLNFSSHLSQCSMISIIQANNDDACMGLLNTNFKWSVWLHCGILRGSYERTVC